MRPRVKYQVIYMNKDRYPVSVMCQFLGVSRSGYYGYVKKLNKPAHDAALTEIICEQQKKCDGTYGYRRMWKWLNTTKKIYRNPKTILRIMKKYGLLSEIRRRRKWQQMGQQLHKYENLLNREFQTDRPNHKWVTDISYIHTGQGVLYLSMIRDLFDNSIVAHKTGTTQTVNLVLDTIRLAMHKEKKVAAELQLHSDQGFQYTSQAYFKLTQSYGITPSMSRKGNPYDNAMAENFFSILKTECIYRHKPKSFREANDLIDRYIHFYNHERIQLKTGVAPFTLRHSA
ncbi:MAG: IS3 family transposase [Clostridia bacterium]|nr:IS3 family transposase [Clostridia bacterium]